MATADPIRAEFRTGDGARIRYAVDSFAKPWERPPTLVLLHAAMGTMHRFHRWMPQLVGRWRVVRWDMRGHGGSGLPPEGAELSVGRLTQDLVELLDHLELDAAHVVGSSTGGIIGMHAAVTHPRRVLSLASYAAIPGLAPSTGHNDYTAWTDGLAREGVAAFLRRTIGQRFDLGAVEPGFVDWWIDDAAGNDPAFLGRFVRMMTGFDFSDRLREIACPALFVVPSGDPVHSDENYQVLRRVPDHRFVVYKAMPHNITDAVPDRCARDLVAFLEAIGAGGSTASGGGRA
jgi:3-oxoadipate enol-lactonase